MITIKPLCDAETPETLILGIHFPNFSLELSLENRYLCIRVNVNMNKV